MTVKELREILEGIDDNIEVVYPSKDHSYSPLMRINQDKAEKCDAYAYLEYADEENRSFDDSSSKVVNVVVLNI